jgi:hypothetical protein
MTLVAADPSGRDARRPIIKTKDSVMEYGPLVAVLSLMLTALGVGIAIGLAMH